MEPNSEQNSEDHSSQMSTDETQSSFTSSSPSSDSGIVVRKRGRPRRQASQFTFIDPDSPPNEPVLKVIKRPGKRGRPPRRWVYSDSDDVFCDEPKDKLVKRLSRNENEKMRRDRLNTYVAELAHLLPMVVAANRKMEKSSILRLAVNYLRVYHDFIKNTTKPEPVWNGLDPNTVSQLIQECNGDFLIVTSKRGVIAFASEGFTNSLGHKLVDVLGQTMFELIHPDDYDVYLQQFHSSDSCKRQFGLRLLNNLANDQQEFVNVTFQGCVKNVQPLQSPFFKGKEDDSMYLVAIGKMPLSNLMLEDFKFKVPCSDTIYMAYHNALGEMQFVDPRVSIVAGYMPNELVGEDAYQLVAQEDQPLVAHSHFKIMTEDLVVTVYRGFTKSGTMQHFRTVTHKVLHPWTKRIKYLISVIESLSEEDGERLLKEFIQQKQIDEVQAEMSTLNRTHESKRDDRSADDMSPDSCMPDSTMSSSSQSDSMSGGRAEDSSDPMDIPGIRVHLPRLWDRCKQVQDECKEEDKTDLQSVTTSSKDLPEAYDVHIQDSVERTTDTAHKSTTSEDPALHDKVKHVPHRLRSLIRPVSQGFVVKPTVQRYKTCTKAYRSNKLSNLLSGKSKDKDCRYYNRASTVSDEVNEAQELNKEAECILRQTSEVKDCSSSVDSDPSDPEPCSSSAMDKDETSSSEGQLLCTHESSFSDRLASIKSPQLPLWTRHQEMRKDSQSSLLFKMLKQMEDDDQGVHSSNGDCDSKGKPYSLSIEREKNTAAQKETETC
uniref:Methoprene-tolerant protein n=1 Tax=Platynereis dumerilii TaxID=6359 RepID=A0A1L5YJB3_PLADU|nr:methoprene-tolerant protein [Platynereis dumerilii]